MRSSRGQAIIEYLLVVVMVAITVAVIIRGTGSTLYGIWTGLARQIASPCVNCDVPPAPDLP